MEVLDLSGATEEIALRIKQAALLTLPDEWGRYKRRPKGRFLTGELSAYSAGFSAGMSAVLDVLAEYNITLQVEVDDEA